jgi:hypothetical protein
MQIKITPYIEYTAKVAPVEILGREIAANESDEKMCTSESSYVRRMYETNENGIEKLGCMKLTTPQRHANNMVKGITGSTKIFTKSETREIIPDKCKIRGVTNI